MNKIVVGIVIAVIAIGGGLFFWSKVNVSNQAHETNMQTTSQSQGQANSQQVAAGNVVVIRNFAFAPATLTVKVGEKVTWTNKDSAGHSATADDGSFDTGILPQGQSGSITFGKTGTYPYHCSVHPMMKGTIIVR